MHLSQPVFMKLECFWVTCLHQNVLTKQDNVAASDKFLQLAKNNLQEPEFSPAAL
jgi:hypothetical protein